MPPHDDAVVIEDGAVVFDLARTKYSISGECNKCLLHLWSAERNVVRRVLEVEIKNDVLRLAVQRLGQDTPTKLEICRERDRRTPTAKRAARFAYQQNAATNLGAAISAIQASPSCGVRSIWNALSGQSTAAGCCSRGAPVLRCSV